MMHTGDTVLYTLFGLGSLILIGLVVKVRSEDKNRLKHFNDLKNSGFTADHVMDGMAEYKSINVAFDDTNQKIAFVTSDGISQYRYDEIAKYEWHWVEKNAVKKDNTIHFFMRDKVRPLIKVSMSGPSYTENWMAKLRAILE